MVLADTVKSKLSSCLDKPLAVGLVIVAFAVVAYSFVSGWGVGTGFSLENDVPILASEGEADETDPPGSPFSKSDADGEEASRESYLWVHVSGAVVNPGVYELPDGSRAVDVVEAAGGFREDAAQDALNLARLLSDGEHLVVPSYDEIEAAKSGGVAGSGGEYGESGGKEQGAAYYGSDPEASSPSGSMVGGRININLASSEELQQLSGIGPSTAEKIVADREANGPFMSIEDLMRVSGIGEKKFAAIRDSICVS